MELDITFDCDSVLSVVANTHEGVTVRLKIDHIDLALLGDKIAEWLKQHSAMFDTLACTR